MICIEYQTGDQDVVKDDCRDPIYVAQEVQVSCPIHLVIQT